MNITLPMAAAPSLHGQLPPFEIVAAMKAVN
jgi:hypothetical protein